MVVEEVIIVKNFVKRYGDFEVVRGISFMVKCGEVFVFFGLNGVGKIMIVRMFMIFIRIIFGEVYVNGYDVKKEGLMVRCLIGFVFDIFNFYEEFIVEENLKFIVNFYDVLKENVVRFIKEFNFLVKRKFGKFSLGFKRRVMIVVVLVYEFEIFFFDEFINGFDVYFVKVLRVFIRELNKRGMIIFFIIYNMVEVEMIL